MWKLEKDKGLLFKSKPYQYLVFSAWALSDSCEFLTAFDSLLKASLSSRSWRFSFSIRAACSCKTWCSRVTNSKYLSWPRCVRSSSSYKDFSVWKLFTRYNNSNFFWLWIKDLLASYSFLNFRVHFHPAVKPQLHTDFTVFCQKVWGKPITYLLTHLRAEG